MTQNFNQAFNSERALKRFAESGRIWTFLKSGIGNWLQRCYILQLGF